MVTEERTIEVTLISATDLKKVKLFGSEQKCYVVAFIYPTHKETTRADPNGGVNPTWNSTLKLKCYETHLHPVAAATSSSSSSSSSSSHTITFEIYSQGGFLHKEDKLVGTATVPLQDVAAATKVDGVMVVGLEVHRPTGEVQGMLNLSVKLGAKRALAEHEDPAAPQMPSYSSDKVNSYLTTHPPANESGPKPGDETRPPRNDNSDSKAAVEEDCVTGYPVLGYAFDPLQMGNGQQSDQRQYGGYPPRSNQQQSEQKAYGQGQSGVGPSMGSQQQFQQRRQYGASPPMGYQQQYEEQRFGQGQYGAAPPMGYQQQYEEQRFGQGQYGAAPPMGYQQQSEEFGLGTRRARKEFRRANRRRGRGGGRKGGPVKIAMMIFMPPVLGLGMMLVKGAKKVAHAVENRGHHDAAPPHLAPSYEAPRNPKLSE